jgi:hypothetical protein
MRRAASEPRVPTLTDDELVLLRTFLQPQRVERWRLSLASAARRSGFLDHHLNHVRDLDDRRVTALGRHDDALAVLRARGAPTDAIVVSADPAIDGRRLPLAAVIAHLGASAWGTLVGCVPGRLAYFHDEEGTGRRLVLERR